MSYTHADIRRETNSRDHHQRETPSTVTGEESREWDASHSALSLYICPKFSQGWEDPRKGIVLDPANVGVVSVFV